MCSDNKHNIFRIINYNIDLQTHSSFSSNFSSMVCWCFLMTLDFRDRNSSKVKYFINIGWKT